MELGESACLLGLNVLQVETPHQEVLTPDVLRHQVHLPGYGREREREREGHHTEVSRGSEVMFDSGFVCIIYYII